jgi:hypothetical protein
MQQSIQERNVSFSLLGRAEVLCNTWNRVQSKSLSLLQSISNVVSQRLATFDLPTTLEDHGVDQTRLVFKQTEAMESSIKSLRAVLEMFEKVKNDWTRLEFEAAKHVGKSIMAQAPTKPQPLSTESMIQVTSVTPVQVYDMISKLAYMYKEEFSYKSTLLTTLPLNMSNFDLIQNLIDRWSIESRIDDQVEQELSERVKLYKVVKKVLESVD